MRKGRGIVTLPKGVHRTVSHRKERYHYQRNRGTSYAGPRIKLPNDPRSPEFWAALRRVQDGTSIIDVSSINALLDLYLSSPQFGDLAPGSQAQYRLHLKRVRKAWGNLPSVGLRPHHIRELLDSMADRKGSANTLLGVLRALSDWGLERGHFEMSITHGVKPYKTEGGHKPWTAEQCASAAKTLSGLVKRAYFLGRYTGQRISDVVRLGPTMLDEGGFRLAPQKTGHRIGEIWIPIEPPLAAEMATWDHQLGPYVPMAIKTLEDHFARQRDAVPELVGLTFHGLRGTRVIELRERGHNTLEISAQVGMSQGIIERYCRFADRKKLGKAAVLNLAEKRNKKA
jgi:integrase